MKKQRKLLSGFSNSGWKNFLHNFAYIKQHIPARAVKHRADYYLVDLERLHDMPAVKMTPAYKVLLKHRVIKPADCLFCFGIPASPFPEDFSLQDFLKIRSDYLQGHDRPSNYKHMVLNPLQDFMKFLRCYKIKYHVDTREEDLSHFFRQGYSLIMLFTHMIFLEEESIYSDRQEDGLELGLQFLPFSQFMELIPGEFSGTLDLCVCNGVKILPLLRRHRPNCSSHFQKIKTKPSHWLPFYKVLFSLIKYKNLCYPDAVLLTVKKFQETI